MILTRKLKAALELELINDVREGKGDALPLLTELFHTELGAKLDDTPLEKYAADHCLPD